MLQDPRESPISLEDARFTIIYGDERERGLQLLLVYVVCKDIKTSREGKFSSYYDSNMRRQIKFILSTRTAYAPYQPNEITHDTISTKRNIKY